MEVDERKFIYGQFGYGKYVYPPEELEELRIFLKTMF
jgi:spore photoproduct lyase